VGAARRRCETAIRATLPQNPRNGTNQDTLFMGPTTHADTFAAKLREAFAAMEKTAI